MKKIMVLSAACLLSVSMLVSACGKNGSEPNSQTTPSASPTDSQKTGQPVKLKFWGGVPEESGPKAVVDKWNAANKDIQVEYVRFVNDDPGNTKLDTALLSTNDAPDLFVNYNDAFMDRRINAGMVEPLDDLIKKSGFDVDGVIGSKNLAKNKDKLYYLPGAKSMNVMLFNKSSLDAIKEPVPVDWTWDDYAALSKKLTKQGQFGTFLAPSWEPLGFQTLTTAKPVDAYYAADGTSNLNDPAFKKGLEIQKQLLDAKALRPYAEGVANKILPEEELLKEKVAMAFSGTYLIRYIKDDKAFPNRKFQVAFAPVPQMEKGKNINSGGYADKFSINSHSANKEAAMKFLSWYLMEGNMEMVPGGRIPSNQKADIEKVAALLIGDKGQYFDKESFMNVIKANYTFAMNSTTVGSAAIRKALFEETEKYLLGAQPLDKTVEVMKQRADEAIKAASK
jgi:multiple sugar transport system substrate-binding protein